MTDTEDNQTLDVAVILHVLLRRRWWILLMASATALLTIIVAQLLPNRYTSEATVLVIQQQVPERYVTPTTTTDISQALRGMTQEVLSRSRLLSIVDSEGLYPKEKKHLAPEVLLERMRRDINIQPLEVGPERRDVNAFKISFVADTPQRAQQIAGKLTSLFIQENVNMREHQATVTTDFLQEQLEEVKKQLADQEARVQAYKMEHLGELPEQQPGNVSILAGLSSQLQNTEAALSRAQEQKVYFESLLRGYQSLSTRSPGTIISPAEEVTMSPTEVLTAELHKLQTERNALLSKYTPDHPDVLRANAEIAKTAALLDRTKANAPSDGSHKTDAHIAAAADTDSAPAAQVRSQLEANHTEIENMTRDAARLKATIEHYQQRLNATPVREQQLAGMLRDYDLLKQNYADLLKKQLESGLSKRLEKRQEGQQFRLVDPPSLPTLPSSPKRLKICFGAAAAGLALGVAIAFLMELMHGSFHSEKQLRSRIKLPLVVALPLLLTRREQRRRKLKMTFEWLAGSVLVIIVLAAELFVYRRG